MKIVHVVGGKLTEGAARGAYWLHRGLVSQGVDSTVLVDSNDNLGMSDVVAIQSSARLRLSGILRRHIDHLPLKYYKKSRGFTYSPSIFGYALHQDPLIQSADIVHLHWVNNGLLNVRHLLNINKPIVWTMRDMWPVTGGCHYALECNRYKTGCGACPQLGSSSSSDLSRFLFRRKQSVFNRVNLVGVGISEWVSQCARESPLWTGKRIETIDNTVDANEFMAVDKTIAKTILGVPAGKKIILVGALNLADPYKGLQYFTEALTHIVDKDNYHVLSFGKDISSALAATGIGYTAHGVLRDTLSLRLLYSAADVFVSPSKMEAFGKTIVESMCCGTPVVAFDATGPASLIRHKVDGYLATAFDALDLLQGILWVCHCDNYETVASAARTEASERFSPARTARQYIALYEGLMNEKMA